MRLTLGYMCTCVFTTSSVNYLKQILNSKLTSLIATDVHPILWSGVLFPQRTQINGTVNNIYNRGSQPAGKPREHDVKHSEV